MGSASPIEFIQTGNAKWVHGVPFCTVEEKSAQPTCGSVLSKNQSVKMKHLALEAVTREVFSAVCRAQAFSRMAGDKSPL